MIKFLTLDIKCSALQNDVTCFSNNLTKMSHVLSDIMKILGCMYSPQSPACVQETVCVCVVVQETLGDVVGVGRLAHQSPVYRRLLHQGVVFERDIHMGKQADVITGNIDRGSSLKINILLVKGTSAVAE